MYGCILHIHVTILVMSSDWLSVTLLVVMRSLATCARPLEWRNRWRYYPRWEVFLGIAPRTSVLLWVLQIHSGNLFQCTLLVVMRCLLVVEQQMKVFPWLKMKPQGIWIQSLRIAFLCTGTISWLHGTWKEWTSNITCGHGVFILKPCIWSRGRDTLAGISLGINTFLCTKPYFGCKQMKPSSYVLKAQHIGLKAQAPGCKSIPDILNVHTVCLTWQTP